MPSAQPSTKDRDERLRSWRLGIKLGTIVSDAERFAELMGQLDGGQANISTVLAEVMTPGLNAVMEATSEEEFLDELRGQQPPITKASVYEFLNLQGTAAEKVAKLKVQAEALITAAQQLPDKIRARRRPLGEVYSAMLDAGFHAARGPEEYVAFRQAATKAEIPDRIWEAIAAGLQNPGSQAEYLQLQTRLVKDVEHYLVFEF